KLLCLNVGMELLLLVFQPHSQISDPSRTPEKVEVISHSFALIELGHRAEKPVLSLEPDGSVLHSGCFARGCGAPKLTTLTGCLNVFVRICFLLAGRRFGQQIKFRFAKLEI